MSEFLGAMWQALNGTPEVLERVCLVGAGELPSVYAVSDFAAAAIGVAGAAVAD